MAKKKLFEAESSPEFFFSPGDWIEHPGDINASNNAFVETRHYDYASWFTSGDSGWFSTFQQRSDFYTASGSSDPWTTSGAWIAAASGLFIIEHGRPPTSEDWIWECIRHNAGPLDQAGIFPINLEGTEAVWTPGTNPYFTFTTSGAESLSLIYAVDGPEGVSAGAKADVFIDNVFVNTINFYDPELVGNALRLYQQRLSIDIPDIDTHEIKLTFSDYLSGARYPWMNIDAVEVSLLENIPGDIESSAEISTFLGGDLLPRWMSFYTEPNTLLGSFFGIALRQSSNWKESSKIIKNLISPKDISLSIPRRIWKSNLPTLSQPSLSAEVRVESDIISLRRVSSDWELSRASDPVFMTLGSTLLFRNLHSTEVQKGASGSVIDLDDLDPEGDVWFQYLNAWKKIPAGSPFINGDSVTFPDNIPASAWIRYTSLSRANLVNGYGKIIIYSGSQVLGIGKPIEFSLESPVDYTAHLLGINRLDSEDQESLINRIYSIFRAKGGATKQGIYSGVSRELGLIKVQEWDTRENLILDNATKSVIIENLPQLVYVRRENLRDRGDRTNFIPSGWFDSSSLRLWSGNTRITSGSNPYFVSGRVITFSNPQELSIQADYSYQNYTTLKVGEDFQVLISAPYLPPSLYKVYTTQNLSTYSLSDKEKEFSLLYNPDDTPSDLLNHIVSLIDREVPFTIGSLSWGGNWFASNDFTPNLSFLPLAFDRTV
jgi:hypothetical protein